MTSANRDPSEKGAITKAAAHLGGALAARVLARRTFLRLVTGSLLAAPLAAEAQPLPSPVRIGFLPLGLPSSAYDRSLVEAFRQGLRDVGLIENEHIVLEVVWAGSQSEIAGAVAELLERGAKLLVTCGTSNSVGAQRQASRVPILFISVGNPVGIGLVESLSAPGGNITGFSDLLAELSGKYVELARDLGTSRTTTIDYLWHTGWQDGQHRLYATERAATSLRMKLRPRAMSDLVDMNSVMAAIKKGGAVLLIVQPSPFTYGQRDRIIKAAMAHGLATIFAFPPAAREGALIAYGPDYAYLYRQATPYVDRVLKGTKPANLPVQQPSKYELIINLKTAKALGVTVPPALLHRADEVIE